MTRVLSIILSFWLTSSVLLLAQNYEPEELENFFEKISKDSEISPQLDEIEYLMKHKIILDNTKTEDLTRLPGISYGLAEKIVDLIKKYPNLDMKMLFDSLELTHEQFTILNLCTEFGIEDKDYGISARLRNQNQLNKIAGFEEGAFHGDKLDLYEKYQGFYKSTSASLILAKKSGEVKVNDFISGNFKSEISGFQFILGDYYSSFGFGSILWRGLGSRKGADVISPVIGYGSGIMPNNSAIENSFFRGIALSKSFEFSTNSNLKVQLQFANSPRSGSLDSTGRISSLYSTGLFRTSSEISKKNTFYEKSAGSAIEYSHEKLKIGANTLYLKYNKPISSDPGSGLIRKEGLLSALYGYYHFSNLTVGGEISRDILNNYGLQSGLQYENSNLSAAINFRSFSSQFNSPYGYMFGETYNPVNQTGVYFGVNYKCSAKLEFSSYCDIYRSSKPNYQTFYPVKGTDYFLQSGYFFNEISVLTLRIQYENKTDKMTDTLGKAIVYQKSGTSLRIDFLNRISERFTTRFRLESSIKSFEGYRKDEAGYTGFCELNWKILPYIKTGCRFSYFSTPSYETAIWEFEGVVPGIMPTRVLYGDGIKFLGFAGFSLSKNYSLWIVWSIFKKYNVSTLGSGYDEILNNTERKLLIQLELGF